MRRLYHSFQSHASGNMTCPRCGADAFRFYRDTVTREIIGCADCLERVDADELSVEQEENDAWNEIDRIVDDILERRAMREDAC